MTITSKKNLNIEELEKLNLDPHGVSEELAKIFFEEVTDSLFYFDKLILGYKDMDESVHLQLGEFVNKRYLDPIDEGKSKPFKLVLLPRGSFKSSVVTIGYTVQSIVKNPNIRILIANEKLDNAKTFLSEIKGHFESNEILRNFYGDFISKFGWREDSIIVSKRTKNLKEPTVSCAGVEVVKVGMHYDLIIMDDLVSDQNSTTKEQIDKVKDFYRLALPMLEPGGEIIVIGTRWHFNDLYNHLIENEKHRFNYYIRGAYTEDKKLWFPNRLTEEFLQDQRRSQSSYQFACNPGEASIFMSDVSFKRIDDVKVGDSVVGWVTPSKGKKRLVPSEVLEVNSRIAEVVKIKFKSGREIRCTADHQWYTGRTESNNDTHKEYNEAKIGRKLRLVVEPFVDNRTEEEKRLSAWLGGMFDGEGGCSANASSIFIHQSFKNNPEVCNALENTFKELGYDYGVSRRYDKDTKAFYLRGGLQTKVRFVNECKPIKQFNIIRSIFTKCTNFAKEKDEVIEIIPDGKERVYALTTETGNYIAWGYASKNCQYLNNPIDDENASFRKDWIKYYSMKLGGKLIPQDSEAKEHYNLNQCRLYMHIDPATSDRKRGDFTAFIITAISPEDFVYVVYAKREKINLTQMIARIFELYKKFPNIKKILIEMQATQQMIKFPLFEEQKRRRIYLPIEEIQQSRMRSKGDRIIGLVPRFEFGTIFIKPDMVDLEDELLRFPVGQHDDLIDALSFGLAFWKKPGVYQKEEVPKLSFKRLLLDKKKSKDTFKSYMQKQAAIL